MALLRTPREKWIDAGLRALAAGGPEAVRVELLAQALGVTKGGFYGQFGDRRALLDAMLDSWEQAVIDAVIERIEREGGDARAKLRRLFSLAGSDRYSGELLAVELAVRDWARRDAAVAERLRRVDERRMAYLRPLFGELTGDPADVEARCLLVLTLYVGLHFVAVDHGEHRRADVVRRSLRLLEG